MPTLHFPILVLLYFLRILSLLIVIRILLSWFIPGSSNRFYIFIVETTEQVLKPIRSIIPNSGAGGLMIDWSPLIALLLIDFLRYAILSSFSF